MTDKCISPLRRRMIEDMTVRNFAAKTQHDYVQRVKSFAAFLGRSPDTAKPEDMSQLSAASGVERRGYAKDQRHRLGAAVLLQCDADRPEIVKHLSSMHQPRKMPVVFKPRGGCALSGGSAGHQVQGGAECRLRCRAAGFRGRCA